MKFPVRRGIFTYFIVIGKIFQTLQKHDIISPLTNSSEITNISVWCMFLLNFFLYIILDTFLNKNRVILNIVFCNFFLLVMS